MRATSSSAAHAILTSIVVRCHYAVCYVPDAGRIRRVIGAAVPVVGIGRIVPPELAEAALQRGDCDLAAMTRGHIGSEHRKQAHCWRARSNTGVRGSKSMNRPQSCGIAHGLLPQSGRWTRCSEVGTCVRSKEVLVAGAGPAGLKAAEIAARRGHRVTVYEEAQDLGGRLPHLRGTSARARFESVTWLVGERAHLGVEIHSNARLTADDISRIAPDTVVVATGAIPPPGPVGLELQGPRYISIDDALYFGAIKSVDVFDQNGTNEPAFVAEELAGRKHRMTFVTPFEVMAPYALRIALMAPLPSLISTGSSALGWQLISRLGERANPSGRPRGASGLALDP